MPPGIRNPAFITTALVALVAVRCFQKTSSAESGIFSGITRAFAGISLRAFLELFRQPPWTREFSSSVPPPTTSTPLLSLTTDPPPLPSRQDKSSRRRFAPRDPAILVVSESLPPFRACGLNSFPH